MRQTILRLRRELGLTILLSSHQLHEVEQLCTRIAVLHQGRKVFDGPLVDAKQHHKWVRLNVADFAQAVKELRGASLIVADRDGSLVELTDGVQTDAIVRHLVGLGMPVFEIAREEETLEGFYLGLTEKLAQASVRNPQPASRN